MSIDRLVAENAHNGWRLTVWWENDAYTWWVVGPQSEWVRHGSHRDFSQALRQATEIAEAKTLARWPQARVDRLA